MLSFFLKSAWFSPLWYLLEQILTNCLDFCNENKALKRSVSFRFCATLPKRLKIHHCSYIQKCSVLRNHTFQLFSKHSSGPMFYGSVYHSQLFFCSCFKLCPRKVLSKLLTDKFSSFVKVSCSFVQVYQDKVYDLLNPESNDELCVREHPRKGELNNLQQLGDSGSAKSELLGTCLSQALSNTNFLRVCSYEPA